MKEVININIGGVVFAIEKAAHKALEKYLSEVKKHFKTDPANEEILEDIESSIAEKFITKKRNANTAVTEKDVKSVIAQLGTVEELSEEDDESEDINNQDTTPRRLYRSSEDVIVGGVASGIGHYFNIDPVLIRGLFILFAIFSGFGLAVYLVLWIIVPKAKTPSQKLAMKGKNANLESISEYIEEKIKEVPVPTKNIFKKVLNFPIILIKYLLYFIKKTFPMFRISIGSLFLLISIVFIFAISTIFMTVLNADTQFEMDAQTNQILSSFFHEFKVLPPLFALYTTLMIPALFGFFGSVYLTFKRKVLNIGIVILMIFIWMFALSFTVVNLLTQWVSIEKLAYAISNEIETNDGQFYFRINGENLLEQDVYIEEIPPLEVLEINDAIPFGTDSELIGGDAVPTPEILGQKEFSIIGSNELINPENIHVQINDKVTLRFKANDESSKLIIYAFNTQTDFSHGGTTKTTFHADKEGVFPIYIMNQKNETKIMGNIIIDGK